MTKHLVFYWYVPERGWDRLYDLHIKNLNIYKNCFDKVTFVISADDDVSEEYREIVDFTVDKIKSVFEDVEFVRYKNDRINRESSYFYSCIVDKLDVFPEDEILFFAHNKGIDSWYAEDRLETWINLMYFENLHDIWKIDSFFDKKTVCCVGTYTIMDLKPWDFLKYMWHYSGSFFWMSPYRISMYIKEHNEKIPEIGRYSTEGFLGSIIPNDDMYRVAILGKATEVHLGNLWIENRMTEEEKVEYEKLYGKLVCTVRKSPMFSNRVYKLVK